MIELVIWNARFRRGTIPLGSVHRSHEAVSAARHIGDETIAILTIAQRFAQSRDVELKISLLYKLLRPDARKEFLLCDHYAWALKKNGENFVRPATKPNMLFSFKQKPLIAKQPKRPKGKFAGCGRFLPGPPRG